MEPNPVLKLIMCTCGDIVHVDDFVEHLKAVHQPIANWIRVKDSETN